MNETKEDPVSTTKTKYPILDTYGKYFVAEQLKISRIFDISHNLKGLQTLFFFARTVEYYLKQ